MLKDLFLLPSPAANKVPRGKKREELSSKGFVSFAVQLNLNMTQAEVEGVIFSEFSNKLAKCTEPAFEFLKAVNEKLIKQDTKEWNGKVVKHMTGTGPLYVRSMQELPMDSDSDLESSDDDCNILERNSKPINHYFPPNISTSQVSITSENAQLSAGSYCLASKSSSEVTQINVKPRISSTSSSSTSHQQPPDVHCPICGKSFPQSFINYHANSCAEMQAQHQYNELMSDVIDSDLDLETDVFAEVPNSPKEIDNGESVHDLVKRVANHVDAESKPNRIDVRRKFAWKDYLMCRRRQGFATNAKLRVRFVGEPAVDTGGPLREFFSGL